VGYVKCGPRETLLDNEALRFRPMVMSGSHCLSLSGPRETFLDNEALWFSLMVMSGSHYLSLTSGINDTINTKTLPQGTWNENFIHGSHRYATHF
jgi:hypothetical protein